MTTFTLFPFSSQSEIIRDGADSGVCEGGSYRVIGLGVPHSKRCCRPAPPVLGLPRAARGSPLRHQLGRPEGRPARPEEKGLPTATLPRAPARCRACWMPTSSRAHRQLRWPASALMSRHPLETVLARLHVQGNTHDHRQHRPGLRGASD